MPKKSLTDVRREKRYLAEWIHFQQKSEERKKSESIAIALPDMKEKSNREIMNCKKLCGSAGKQGCQM